jgi:multidrug efflux system outer membrane protein
MRKTLIAALLALLASGCMIGPDYLRPQVETPPAWRLSEQAANDLANTAWWKQFDDPVLDDLVSTALHNNHDLLIATARIEEFAGRYGIVRAELFPQVGAGYEASRQRQQRLIRRQQSLHLQQLQAVINASWEIDIWGRIRRLNEAARAQLLGSEEARRAVILSLVGRVAGAYINLRDLDRQLEIARATALSRGESYDVFQERYLGGIISMLELSQNKSQYDEALASIPPIEKAIAQQENGLSVLLGRNPGPDPRGKNIDQLSLPAIPAGLPSDLLERRPDIQRAEQNLIAANALIGAAKAAYFPTISLTGLFGYASNGLSDLFNSQSKAWQYAAADHHADLHRRRHRRPGAGSGSTAAASPVRLPEGIQEAFREVNDALINQDRTREQLRAQKQQVKALEQYSATARLRYDNGYTSYIEVSTPSAACSTFSCSTRRRSRRSSRR